jgi:hypothetical protein
VLVVRKVQQRRMRQTKIRKNKQEMAAVVTVVCDTGASMAVAGTDSACAQKNIRNLGVPVSLGTAKGSTTATKECDLGASSIMSNALVVPECPRTLCPVVTVCEKLVQPWF